MRAPKLRRPTLVRSDGHVLDAERREHARNVAREGVVEDDHQHLVGAEALAVLEHQIGEPVEADGGLAASGAALDDHQAARRLADELELPRVDERGDLAERLVLDVLVRIHRPELADRVMLLRTHRRALPAL